MAHYSTIGARLARTQASGRAKLAHNGVRGRLRGFNKDCTLGGCRKGSHAWRGPKPREEPRTPPCAVAPCGSVSDDAMISMILNDLRWFDGSLRLIKTHYVFVPLKH